MNNESKLNSPLKTIRLHCIDCMGGSYSDVKNCTASKSCKLWSFRLGTNPMRKQREYSEEEKQVFRDRLERARTLKNK